MRVHLDVWSDYVCPFCFLMVPVLDALADHFGPTIHIAWHAYELRPDPVPTLDPDGDYLRDVWTHSVYPLAASLGMDLQLPNVQPRSRLAHEAANFARHHGRFPAMHLAIFQAFFHHSANLADARVLVEIGSSIGLDRSQLASALHHRTQRDAVLAEEERAAELGLTAVPATVIHRHGDPAELALTLTGTQSYHHLHTLISRLTH